MTEFRFEVYGRQIAIAPGPRGWQTYLLGEDGKRRPGGFVVPDFIAQDELLQFLADLFHESATPFNGEPRQLW